MHLKKEPKNFLKRKKRALKAYDDYKKRLIKGTYYEEDED